MILDHKIVKSSDWDWDLGLGLGLKGFLCSQPQLALLASFHMGLGLDLGWLGLELDNN